jgi:sugar/nucleoside kinase (ribokinase family)
VFDVIGVGESSVDEVFRLPGFPQPHGVQSKMRIASRTLSPGGQVATALCTCASLGLRAAYAGAIGSDDHGRLLRDALAQRGVDLTHLAVRDAATRYAVILIDARTGERVVLWDRDPRLVLDAAELPAAAIADARLLHVDNVDEDIAIAAATIARSAGHPVTTDIDTVSARTRELVSLVNVAIFGEHALAEFTGDSDPERALYGLRRTCDAMLSVTLGAHGALLLAGDRLYRATGHGVQAVDTTGAGDVFRGAFIYALLRGDTPDRILAFANAAAAVSCTREGAMGGVPAVEEIQRVLNC